MADEERSLGDWLLASRHTRIHAVCVPPTLNTAVRVEFMVRQVPSQAGNETGEVFDTLLYGWPVYCIHVSSPALAAQQLAEAV
jgi:hypothetical protein